MFNRILRFLKWTVIILLILISPLIIGALIVEVDPVNSSEFYDEFPRDMNFVEGRKQYYLDSLRSEFGREKSFGAYEEAALIALSRYPELHDVSVSFELSTTGAPMESSFEILSLLRNAINRKYIIYLLEVDNSMFDPILMKSLPFDAQVGILAHELGHTAYYHRLSFFQIIRWALFYGIYPEFRATHERTTDLIPVYRGLGNQILNYAEYVRHDPSTVDFYEAGKWFMDTFYMTPTEIRAEMESLGYGRDEY